MIDPVRELWVRALTSGQVRAAPDDDFELSGSGVSPTGELELSGSGVSPTGKLDLSGSGVSPTDVLAFLTGSEATGRLDFWDEHAVGIVFLEHGRIAGAIFGSESGMAALEALVVVLPRPEFGFSARMRARAENVALETGAILRRLGDLANDASRLTLPSQDVVPRLLGNPGKLVHAHEGEDGDLVRVLRAIDGRRTVAELGVELGLAATLTSLARLRELHFVSTDDEPTAQPAPRLPFRDRLQNALLRPVQHGFGSRGDGRLQ